MAKVEESQFAMIFSRFEFHKRGEWKGRESIPDWFYSKAPFFLRHILWRRHLNMNSIILIVGGVRTGKSYMGLKIAETYCKLLNKKFDVNKQCSFDIIPFLKWSQDETDNVFVLDEVGVNLNPQEWYSVQSRVFRNFTQAQGYLRNVMILVLPNISFLLKSIRFMCNYVLETRNQGKGFIRKVAMDHSRGKGYLMNIGSIKFSLPSKETIKEYEKMKKIWNKEHLKEDIQYLLIDKEKKQRVIRFDQEVYQKPIYHLPKSKFDEVPV